MAYCEDDYLLISGIQHFIFCKRQWALIHLEQQWAENFRTTDGELIHKNAHDSGFTEKRNGTIITRGMPVSSARLGISGECDVVEFHKFKNGVALFGREEKYLPIPIEYKRGEPKRDDCDILQLTAQAICLEEMLCCEVDYGYLFYNGTRRRVKVDFTSEIRRKTEETILKMHELYARKHTPKVTRTKSCNACSLKDLCLPTIMNKSSAEEYMRKMLFESGGELQ